MLSNRLNETKQSFIAAHDYGHGAVLYRIFARSKREVSVIFPPPNWEIVTEEELSRRGIRGLDSLLESDVDAKEDWLIDYIKRADVRRTMEAQGKQDIPFFGFKHGRKVYREIWARSVAEVRRHHPGLIPMYGMVITPEISKRTGMSDIDQPDEFLAWFRKSRPLRSVGLRRVIEALRHGWLRRPLTDEESAILSAVREKYPQHPNDEMLFIWESNPLLPKNTAIVFHAWGNEGDGPSVNLTTLAALLKSGLALDEIKRTQF